MSNNKGILSTAKIEGKTLFNSFANDEFPVVEQISDSKQIGHGDGYVSDGIVPATSEIDELKLMGNTVKNLVPSEPSPTEVFTQYEESALVQSSSDTNIKMGSGELKQAIVEGNTYKNLANRLSNRTEEQVITSEGYSTLLKETLGEHTEILEDQPFKSAVLQGRTLVNTIQEPCEDDYVVLGSAVDRQNVTINDTVQGNIKSAILKGNTLVNLHKLENYSVFGFVLDGGINQQFGNNTSYATWRMFDISMLKPNTEYGVFCWVLENTISENYWGGHIYHSADTVFNPSTELRFSAGETGLKFAKLTTLSDFTGKTCGIRHLIDINTPSTEYVKFRCVIVEYQDGMENWDIPYFEGMQSVKMPVLKTVGKNLYNIDKHLYPVHGNAGLTFQYETNSIIVNGTSTGETSTSRMIDVTHLLKNGNTYTISAHNSIFNMISFRIYNTDGTETYRKTITYDESYHSQVTVYIQLAKSDKTYTFNNEEIFLQIEEGSVATSYELYKSNSLTCNEEVELRGIGDVRDELNLITGELTQRIGEVVLDGSESWVQNTAWNSYVEADSSMFNLPFDGAVPINSQNEINLVCDRLNVDYEQWNTASMSISIFKIPTRVSIVLPNSIAQNISEFKQYLQQNPITIQYQLVTPIVKTVDLIVTDQDGNTFPHIQTQPTVTHITTSSDSLIPFVKIPSGLEYNTIIKPSTKYTIRFKRNLVGENITVDLGGTIQEISANDVTITTPATLTHNKAIIYGKNNIISEVSVIEGDVVGVGYPFFEGMKSVNYIGKPITNLLSEDSIVIGDYDFNHYYEDKKIADLSSFEDGKIYTLFLKIDNINTYGRTDIAVNLGIGNSTTIFIFSKDIWFRDIMNIDNLSRWLIHPFNTEEFTSEYDILSLRPLRLVKSEGHLKYSVTGCVILEGVYDYVPFNDHFTGTINANNEILTTTNCPYDFGKGGRI